MGWIVSFVAPIVRVLALCVVPLVLFVTWPFRMRRYKKQSKAKTQAALKKLENATVDSVKGKYKTQRWGRKWIDYAKAIPPPSNRYGSRKIPDPPRK